MLTLTCDRCGFKLKLIQRLIPKKENTVGGDGQGYRLFWEISNEQDGIGSSYEGDNYFDGDPEEFDKWNWDANGAGTYDEWGINAHLCMKCKKEYKQYIKDYQNNTVELDKYAHEMPLHEMPSLRATIGEIKEKLEANKRAYKDAFLNKNNTPT